MKNIWNANRRLLCSGGLALTLLLLGSCTATPAIRGASGEIVPGSIASIEKTSINGTDHTFVIRGHDRDAPILLWLAGGPGGSELGWTTSYLSDLEIDCVVVNWEQPGVGKAFSSVDIREASVRDYVEYTIEVSEYLIERFEKEKVFLVGHSWGSVIGMLAVEQRPDLYHAFVSANQHVNAKENDRIGYDLVMREASRAGDERAVQRLSEFGPPPYGAEHGRRYVYLFQRLFAYSPRPAGVQEVDSMRFLRPREYSLRDSINLIRSTFRGVTHIYPQLVERDLEREVTRVEVPLYFVTGTYDYTCVYWIAERYFDLIEAPHKRLYRFERSGHNAPYQEPERFVEIIVNDVLPLQ